MKAEHQDAIERARLHDVPPSIFAHGLLVRDLVDAALFELKNIHSPYSKLNEGQQQEVIERITDKAKAAAHNAIAIISSRNVSTIEVTMKEVKFNSKQLTLTSIVDAKDPNRHDLIDSAGRLCLLVMAPNDYDEGLDSIEPDRDQPDLPLHTSELTGSLFDHAASSRDEPEFEGPDPIYQQAVQFVIDTRRPSPSAVQRKFKIGYNRATRLLETMEQDGVLSAPDSHGSRQVISEPNKPTGPDEPTWTDDDQNLGPEFAEVGEFVDPLANIAGAAPKEFGEYTYEDASQLIVLHAANVNVAWLQHRLAIDSDTATSLILRLIDNDVIVLHSEGEASIDNIYQVKAKLSDLVLE
ncbi:DNA translocase FtsK [Pseudomonas sp. RC10]|uniref:DNA translocase FtsK n=1 Tax=Pseudomonas bambusae TaxID=3139142 RepID=UPI003138DD35